MSTSSADPSTSRKPSLLRWLNVWLGSSVGGKFVVALTGLLLTGFVLLHMVGNLQVFLGREALNAYAHGLKKLGPLLWVARGGLLSVFLLHLFLALRLFYRNTQARPVRYSYERTRAASFASRYMALTGLVILFFLLFHLAHFTFGWIDQVPESVQGSTLSTNYLDLKDDQGRHDVYGMVIHGFRNPWVSILYVVAQIALGLHLVHGTRSVFQTLGISHFRYNVAIQGSAYAVTGAVVAGNIVMALAVYFRFIN